MIALLTAIATAILTAFTASPVVVIAGDNANTREWIGGRCTWTPLSISIDGRWYEARERGCPP